MGVKSRTCSGLLELLLGVERRACFVDSYGRLQMIKGEGLRKGGEEMQTENIR